MDKKNTTDLHEFEEGSDLSPSPVVASEASNPSPSPIINKYPNQPSTKPSPSPSPKVDPTDSAPTAKQEPPKPVDPEARRKALLGCLGAFAAILLIFLVLGFVFLATAGAQQSTIARVLGINQGAFINGLITFIHVIFILISLTTFTLAIIGIFRASMAKKGDIFARKNGLRMSLIFGILLVVILVAWGFSFIYLDGKRVQTRAEYIDTITTVPENTLNLSAPVEVIFDATNVQVDRRQYERVSDKWDFGDGETSTGQKTSHIYTEKGDYIVNLTVKVKDKKSGEITTFGEYTTTVSVTNEALTAIITATPQSGEAPLKVVLDGSASVNPDGNIASYEWDLDGDKVFDDAEGDIIENTFDKVGRYKVSLRVTGTTLDESDVAEKEINVKEVVELVPVIGIVDEPATFEVGVNYIFKAEESTSPNGKIEKYEWNFGDESPLIKTKTASHTFNREGAFEVELTITDETGEEAVETKLINIGAQKGSPKAQISTQPDLGGGLVLEGKVPFSVVFSGTQSSDSDNNIIDYEWDFGDGSTTAFGETVTHTYNDVGAYTVSLVVTDADNNSGRITMAVKVDQQGIVAVVTADTIDGNVPLTVTFDASGSAYKDGRITSYKWDFGDGAPEKLGDARISHKYTAIGNYTVTVTVIGSDTSTNTASLNVSVREIPLSACFTTAQNKGPAPFETTFDPGCSTGAATSYFWDFGDGGTSTTVKPSHTFTRAGIYNVILELTDAENTVDKISHEITVTE